MSKPISIQNLLLIRKGDQLLLAMKKRGFGAGNYNGYGGKLQPGETIEQSLVREVREESGLILTGYHKVGFMRFDNIDKLVDVHIFEALEWSGEPVETEEMAPKWFGVADLPYKTMWPSDPIWYPYYLAGTYFEGEVVFDQDYRIASSRIGAVQDKEGSGDKK